MSLKNNTISIKASKKDLSINKKPKNYQNSNLIKKKK